MNPTRGIYPLLPATASEVKGCASETRCFIIPPRIEQRVEIKAPVTGKVAPEDGLFGSERTV